MALEPMPVLLRLIYISLWGFTFGDSEPVALVFWEE
jgi:hypothetical protein